MSGHHGTDGPTPLPKKQLFTAAMRRWKESESHPSKGEVYPTSRDTHESSENVNPARHARAANKAAELSTLLRPSVRPIDAREILARAGEPVANKNKKRADVARSPSSAPPDALLLDRTRAARQKMEARRRAADDEVQALRERLRRETAAAERDRASRDAAADEAAAKARLAAAAAAKERRLAAARRAAREREDAERRRRRAEEIEAAELEAKDAAKERERERVRTIAAERAAAEAEERNARRERTRQMASAFGAWRRVGEAVDREVAAHVETLMWRRTRRTLRAWKAAVDFANIRTESKRLAREAEMGDIARLHRTHRAARVHFIVWRHVARDAASARRDAEAEESWAREAATAAARAATEAAAEEEEKRAAVARKEAEAIASADATAAEERRLKKEALLARVGAPATTIDAEKPEPTPEPTPTPTPPAENTVRKSADDATVADLLEFVNLAKRVHADLGGVPLTSPRKSEPAKDDDSSSDDEAAYESPPKKRKTELGLSSVMEDDEDALSEDDTLGRRTDNPWMHRPVAAPASEPMPAPRRPVETSTLKPVEASTKAATMARRAEARAAARAELRAKAAAAREAAAVREANKALLEGEAERALEAAQRAEALAKRRNSKAAEERKRRAAVIAAESTALAAAHHTRALLLRVGLNPWRALVTAFKDAVEEAEYRAETTAVRVPFRAWFNRSAAKVSGLRAAAAVITGVDATRRARSVLTAWSGWSRATTLASFRAKAKAWDAWAEAKAKARDAENLADSHRRESSMRKGWIAWKLEAGARLERLEREEHAAWLAETHRIGRGALREWRRNAVAAGLARREAETKDKLFLKVGRWLEELKADKALTPSPASKGPSPENREERRARYKTGTTPVATPVAEMPKTRGLNLADAPVPELAMLRLRNMPQYARVMQAASEASAAASSYVTPPRTQSKIPLPTLKAAPAPVSLMTPVAAPRDAKRDDWLDLDVTPPRVDLLDLTRGITRSPLGAMAVNIEVDSPDLNLTAMAKERPKVKAKAKVNSRKPTIKAKPEKEVSPGGLSEGSRARLGKLAAKKRGQAKDRNDFWKRVG